MSEELVYTAIFKDTAWVRVIGRGIFINSLPIKTWLLSRIEEGYSRLLIDLSDCKSMDSTFMGAVTGLSLRMKRLGRAPITIANVTGHNKRLLETLGLDKFLVLEEKFEIDTSLNWELLPIESLDKLTTTKHMMNAHEKLIGTGSLAEEQFKNVHELLKEDLKKQLDKDKSEKSNKNESKH